MADLNEMENRIKYLYKKQNELVQKLNELVDRMNLVPKDIKAENERLLKKITYLETDLDRLKRRLSMPDEDI